MEYYYNLLENITTGTDSSLIVFFVIVAALVLPLYGFMLKDRKYTRQHDSDKQAKYIEREREILAVIKENSTAIAECTAVIASLKSLIENSGTKHEQAVERIHNRVDDILKDTAHIKALLAKTEK